MELAFIIYLIETVSSEGGHAVLGWILLICMSYVGIHRGLVEDKDKKGYEAFYSHIPVRIIYSTSIFFILWGTFVPSKDSAYKMLAAYGVYEASQSESVNNLAGKSFEVLEKAMDGYLKDKEP